MGSIGIFDSGVGGFTILQAIHDTLPKADLIYLADQINIPYAEKSAEWLINRSRRITKYLQGLGCTTIVIACNTATVSAIADLRSVYPDLVFVGVEPAIKPAALISKTGKILILATKHTLQSQRLRQLCVQYAGDQPVIFQDMPEWVTLAETGKVGSRDTHRKIATSLYPLRDENIKSIVLACTHYPFFQADIQEIFPQATIFDPSVSVADQVKKVHRDTPQKASGIRIYTTGNSEELRSATANLLKLNVKIQSIVV